MSALALRPNFKFISTVAKDDVNTHEHVDQYHHVVPPEDVLPTAVAVVEATMRRTPNAKIMVFLPTARATQLAAEVFEKAGVARAGLPVWEVHSRKSQGQRTKGERLFAACIGPRLSCR